MQSNCGPQIIPQLIPVEQIRCKKRTATFKTFTKLFKFILANAILCQLSYIINTNRSTNISKQSLLRRRHLNPFGLPAIRLAEAIECKDDYDCGSREKICHENKCICARERPIEDQDRCLGLSLIGEQCSLNEQCLGNSHCVDGICSCANEAISLFNPSSKIYYCHPKRRLGEECNYDSQCPSNSYCSTKESGCLCQNGYAPTIFKNAGGIESLECHAKTCVESRFCESEYYQCDDNLCKCLATHFDPTNAKCYRFGSTGGKPLMDDDGGNATATSKTGDDSNIYSIFKDLRENSDRMWLVLIVLILLSILVFVLIFMLMRKYYLGYCWTAHKNEYEPNNKSQTKNGAFNKNSINNKSFRQKKGEVDEDDGDGGDDLVADVSNLMTSSNNNNSRGKKDSSPVSKDTKHHYVKVNINENHYDTSDSLNNRQVMSPLKSSTSTPV